MDDSEPRDEETKLNRWFVSRRATNVRPRITWSDAAGKHTLTLLERTLVGSANNAGLVVADATVSRIHAELEEVDGHVWVRDLDSRNGTYVEDILVAHARVPDGGRIRVGATELRVTRDAEAPTKDLWPEPRFGPLVGTSGVMRELFAQLAQVAATDSSVLIRGETGTGKELVARAIHDASARAGHPMITVDCAALPEQLLEAELFGHARGAFTGAVNDRPGAFQSAEGGTIFLDEVGELPLAMQPKLLRALESKTVRRVGESTHRRVDVRIVSATHRDLRRMVNAGAFREDLYFRLCVLPVYVPPLRQRPEDVALLVEHFLRVHDARLPGSFVAGLASRPWLGNVRELRNFVERAIAFGADRALQMTSERPPPPPSAGGGDDARQAAGVSPHGPLPLDQGFRSFRDAWMERGEREYLERTLQAHGGIVAAAAAAAGLDRTYFYKLMRRYGISPGKDE